jgi:hypothetical protein
MMPHDVKPISRAHVRERRRSRRWVVTLGLVADLEERVSVRGYLFDLSLNGAYIVLDTHAEIGNRVALSFRVGDADLDATALGHVARFVALGKRTGIGVSFTDMSRHCRQFIRALGEQNDSERLASFQLVRKLRLKIR